MAGIASEFRLKPGLRAKCSLNQQTASGRVFRTPGCLPPKLIHNPFTNVVVADILIGSRGRTTVALGHKAGQPTETVACHIDSRFPAGLFRGRSPKFGFSRRKTDRKSRQRHERASSHFAWFRGHRSTHGLRLPLRGCKQRAGVFVPSLAPTAGWSRAVPAKTPAPFLELTPFWNSILMHRSN